MGNANAELMRKAGELLNEGDFPGFLALHTEDVVMHLPGNGPISGDFKGRDGIAAAFQKEAALLDEPPQFEGHDDLGSDDHAVSLFIQTMKRGGRTLIVRQTIIAHVRDGMFSEVWVQPDDPAAVDAFLS